MKILLLAIIMLIPRGVQAEPLWVPLSVYAAVAAADYHSTYQGLQYVGVYEANPFGTWASDTPKVLVAVGTASEVAAAYVLYRVWGKRHPRAFKAVAYGVAAVRVQFPVGNYKMNNELRRTNAPRH